MKLKQLLIRFFFALVLLGSLALQSFHGLEHLEKQFAEKVCAHKQLNSTELTHQHKGFEQCLVCAISFQSGIAPTQFQYRLASTPVVVFVSLDTNIWKSKKKNHLQFRII